VKLFELETVPAGEVAFVTEIGPIAAPAGTSTFSLTELTYVTLVALTPPKLTVEPFSKPKPVIVMLAPGAAFAGLNECNDRLGVNTPALVPVPTGVVSEIVPASAPFGTVASTCVEECTVKVAFTPSKRTAVAPVKAVPEIVTELPVSPELGVNEVIAGASEITAAVALETTGEPLADPLLAVSCTRIVEPTALAGMA
jgi:hypothetical protein